MNRSIWPALALALAALGPTGCSGGADETTAPSDPAAPEGISVTDGRMSLPPVAGNPAAVYFTITNAGTKDMFIRSAFVDGAGTATLHMMATWDRKADMQEITQQPVRAGETVKFAPGGLHVMVSDLDPSLVAGGTTEVTLTFAGGDKVSFPVEILAAGDAR
ncbi:conserved hypothetical protein [Altererythrobacter sp. B11]|uniref:copper chaperone PCu(A)C n=1 Tax=Altererythrobacter sp. B11 TaxID=2060312 RepID=UPI000DC740F5|nr:copper chaperone PCu(A)C [Altererythrobacter sp. B11]BBC73108.1 conserved hypothetical protein [Altererythrobacter sp. B11]